jgi:hypothetical protein
VLNAIPATAGSVSTSYLVDGSVTQAKFSTNVAGNGPTFSAYPSATQSISAGTWTKMQFNTEEWDIGSYYDNATNYRYQPLVAGYYHITGSAESNAVAQNYYLCSVYKNGSQYSYGSNYPASASAGPGAIVSTLVYLNGSTDYVELWAIGTNAWTRGSSRVASYFQGVLVRSA